MFDSLNLKNYHTYLLFLQEKLNKFFENQKPYIFCKKGCDLCCKHARFPYSEIEFQYLLLGATQLPIEIQNIIQNNILNTLTKKKKYKGKKFYYDCPFLVDGNCSVYNFRGVICRTFGLITNGENGKKNVPLCCFKGLNYSNVINLQKKTFSPVKAKKLGNVSDACSFNIGYNFLTDEDFEKSFCLKFGEKKALIDWFEEYFKNKITSGELK